MAFEELEKDPLGQLRILYEELRLTGFEAVQSMIEDYIASLRDYRKNEFPELPKGLRGRIAAAWRRNFEEWGYGV